MSESSKEFLVPEQAVASLSVMSIGGTSVMLHWSHDSDCPEFLSNETFPPYIRDGTFLLRLENAANLRPKPRLWASDPKMNHAESVSRFFSAYVPRDPAMSYFFTFENEAAAELSNLIQKNNLSIVQKCLCLEDETSYSAEVIRDVTRFPGRSSIGIEIKPKWASLPYVHAVVAPESQLFSSVHKEKLVSCRFRMMQSYKQGKGKKHAVSRYCPLDLFSRSTLR